MMRRLRRLTFSRATIASAIVASAVLCATTDAGAQRGMRVAHTSVYHANFNRGVGFHGHFGVGYDSWGRPIAGFRAPLAIGTEVPALPSGCIGVPSGGFGYQRCGSVYYQPVYRGAELHYLTVNPP